MVDVHVLIDELFGVSGQVQTTEQNVHQNGKTKADKLQCSKLQSYNIT
jgi:hypothetical protein